MARPGPTLRKIAGEQKGLSGELHKKTISDTHLSRYSVLRLMTVMIACQGVANKVLLHVGDMAKP